MKKILLSISLAISFLSIFSFKVDDDKSTTQLVIIQFQTMDFEKRKPEIIGALKDLHGLYYVAFCNEQRLLVLNFDLHQTGGISIDNAVRNKIPSDLKYEPKEGTFDQIKSVFSYCLIQENI